MSFVNFIYEKENAISQEFCNKIIEDGVRNIESGVCTEGHKGATQFPHKAFGRHDFQLYMPRDTQDNFINIQTAVFEAVRDYGQEVQAIHSAVLICPLMKFQYTPLGGGYSVWHIEQGKGDASARVLAWSIYLNDVPEGGETEFLYQGARYQPKAGSLLMWPAGITHPHRGNPPLSNEKFIVTGWLLYASTEEEGTALEILHQQNESERT